MEEDKRQGATGGHPRYSGSGSSSSGTNSGNKKWQKNPSAYQTNNSKGAKRDKSDKGSTYRADWRKQNKGGGYASGGKSNFPAQNKNFQKGKKESGKPAFPPSDSKPDPDAGLHSSVAIDSGGSKTTTKQTSQQFLDRFMVRFTPNTFAANHPTQSNQVAVFNAKEDSLPSEAAYLKSGGSPMPEAFGQKGDPENITMDTTVAKSTDNNNQAEQELMDIFGSINFTGKLMARSVPVPQPPPVVSKEPLFTESLFGSYTSCNVNKPAEPGQGPTTHIQSSRSQCLVSSITTSFQQVEIQESTKTPYSNMGQNVAIASNHETCANTSSLAEAMPLPLPQQSLKPSNPESMTFSVQNNYNDDVEDTRGVSMIKLKELMRKYQQQRTEEVTKQNIQMEKEKAKFSAPRHPFNKSKVPRAILEQTRLLPIYSKRNELVELVRNNQFVIVIGETGSGKSTQTPQYLVEAGLHSNRKIGITQPRRVAAKSLAERVAKECGVTLGTSVGYAVRFDKKVSDDTIIKYMTDGILVKECIVEVNLDAYSIIIIDEAHERSIHSDVCFGLLKRAARKRPDLKVIISSATLEVGKFSPYFNNAPVLNVTGKGYEVEILYNPLYDYLIGAVDTIIEINRRQPRGDILVFLSGQDEVEQVWDTLDLRWGSMATTSLYDDLMVVPCYGALPFAEQQKIFEETPPGQRKVVLATNIAETSLTIDGIVYVIDCGFFKQNQYNPRSGIYSLVRHRITKFQAIQRAGRAGRTRAGKCYRLYSEQEFRNMDQATSPEITRCNLESVILDIITLGIPNPLDFEFMDPPQSVAIAEAVEHLQELSALDADINLTYNGKRMSEFPLDPSLAKVVLESDKLNCSSEVLKIVALLSTQYQNLFSRSKRDRHLSKSSQDMFNMPDDGDFISLLQVYNAWLNTQQSEKWCENLYIQYRILSEAEEIRTQLSDILYSRGISTSAQSVRECSSNVPGNVHENIRRAFTAGFFRRVAKKKPTGHAYQILADHNSLGENVYLHPSSGLFFKKPRWVIYHEVMKTTKTFMRGVIPIDPAWIKEYAPEYASKLIKLGVQLS